MKKILVSILVVALLASVSITAFAAGTSIPVGSFTVTGETLASGEQVGIHEANFSVNPAVVGVTGVADDPLTTTINEFVAPVTAKPATITLIRTAATFVQKDWHFTEWRIAGSYKLIERTADDARVTIEPLTNLTVLENYVYIDSSAKKIGEFEVSLFSYASGYFLNAGTARFDRYDNGTSVIKKSTFLSDATGLPLVNTASMLTPNFMVNPDGTVTLTRSKSEYAFVGWVFDGDYQIVSGNAGSDSITISVLNGHGETVFGKLGADGYWADVPVFGVYEMYDVTPLIRDTAKDVFDKLKKAVDDFKAKQAETTKAAAVVTTTKAAGAVDSGTKSPGTGGSNLPALAVVILLSSTVAIVAKKRFTA